MAEKFELHSENAEIIDFFAHNSFIDSERFLLKSIQNFTARNNLEDRKSEKNGSIDLISSPNLVSEYQDFLETKKALQSTVLSCVTELKKSITKLEMPFWAARLEKDFQIKVQEDELTYMCINCEAKFKSRKGRALHHRKCFPKAPSENSMGEVEVEMEVEVKVELEVE
jgi:hypothetical protein